MTNYSRLNDDGLLFLLQQLKAEFDKAAVSVDDAISADSSYSNAAGSKAVFDFVTNAVAGLTGFHAEIVSELPSAGISNILYLVPRSDPASADGYDEFLFIGGAFELIGSTDIDLSGFVQESQLHAISDSEISDIVNMVWS